jgi:hypothetical protein
VAEHDSGITLAGGRSQAFSGTPAGSPSIGRNPWRAVGVACTRVEPILLLRLANSEDLIGLVGIAASIKKGPGKTPGPKSYRTRSLGSRLRLEFRPTHENWKRLPPALVRRGRVDAPRRLESTRR